MSQIGRQASTVQLRSQVTCPHCWNTFPPEEVLWITAHPDLRGDRLLGEDAQQCFLATRFTVEGHAIDVKGSECSRLACPQCHLSVSRAFLEMKPLFVSILGAPSSGKSFFLAAMSWQLRNCLRDRFDLSFQDADPVTNQILSGYENTLFCSTQEDQLTTLEKTQQEGNLYESVKYEDRQVWYPKPFVFSVKPNETHPGYAKRELLSRALCLYDNAGEHFLPGGESPNDPGTQHLALSEVLLFMFDPTAHVKFRKACRGKSHDPQMNMQEWTHRQDLVLLEAAHRIRTYSGLGENEKDSRPLVVVVTKFDAWCGLTGVKRLSTSRVVRPVGKSLSAIDREELKKVSGQVRSLLTKFSPELVAAAEGFSRRVTYIPVSATGHSPEIVKTGGFGIRPKDIKPMWVEIPMLYAINCVAESLVRSASRGGGEQSSQTTPSPARREPDVQAQSVDPPAPRLWRDTGT